MSSPRTSVIERGAEEASRCDCSTLRDRRPLAPVHLAVIPRDHVASLGEAEALSRGVSAPARGSIAAAACSAGVAATSYRVITNTGPDAGREVDHLQRQVIGGTRLGGMV